MKKHKKFYLTILVACMVAAAAVCLIEMPPVTKNIRGIYFWKTRFNPTQYELDFLREHRIDKLYVRMFDVTVDDWDKIRPNATIVFDQSLPENVDVVPVIYLENEIFDQYRSVDVSELADNVLERVDKMMRSQQKEYHEVQFDCDWTESTYRSYVALCGYAAQLLHAKDVRLSSTIRLWQTGAMADGLYADEKVLMLYNIGGLAKESTKNSIISAGCVDPYLFKLEDGDSRYGVALPAFGWGVLFVDGEYKGLIHETDYSDTLLYKPLEDGCVRVRESHKVDGRMLHTGEMIRIETSEPRVVKECAKRVRKWCNGTHVLYHLDSTNLSKYTYDEIEDFYSR